MRNVESEVQTHRRAPTANALPVALGTALVGGRGELGNPDVRLNEYGLYSAVSTAQRVPGAGQGVRQGVGRIMPANRPGRRPGLTQEEPYYLRNGYGTRERTDSWDPEHRPGHPVPAEPYYSGDGQGAERGTHGRKPGRHAAPMPAESPYFGDVERTGRGTHGRKPGRHAAPMQAESPYFGDAQEAERGTSSRSWEIGELDDGLYERQAAGIAALISIANDVAAVRSSDGVSSSTGGSISQADCVSSRGFVKMK